MQLKNRLARGLRSPTARAAVGCEGRVCAGEPTMAERRREWQSTRIAILSEAGRDQMCRIGESSSLGRWTLVKRTLRRHGYPPDKQEKATRTVLEQAEVLSAD